MCPFCYIGKRKFEQALDQFENKKDIEIEWKSFQLNPYLKTDPTKNINEYLAEIKGWPLDQAKKMNDRVVGMAKEVGLEYDFDRAVVANSLDAHRLIQLAKLHGKGDAAEEALFKAYFTEGKNIADHPTLKELGSALGLQPAAVARVLDSDLYAAEVEHEIDQAQQYGARGVPFFVLNGRYGVSGAQPVEIFSQALEKSFAEWSAGEIITP